jgi:hypothetical protein
MTYSPFRLAQQCFSYDSTLDESPPIPGKDEVQNNLPSLSNYMRSPRGGTNLRHSQSWDVGGATSAAFRTNPHRAFNFGGLHQTTSQDAQAQTRARIHSDFSATKHTTHANTIELQTPQRIEIEREDALDILACLVERGVAAWNADNAKEEESEESKKEDDDENRSDTSTTESLIASMAEEIRRISQETTIISTDSKHPLRMAVLDELLKSHAYALEMKRAALSASTWLKSIGRCQAGESTNTTPSIIPNEANGWTVYPPPETGGQASGEKDHETSVSNNDSDNGSIKMELLTLKARLHRTEMELKEKTDTNDKLNEELSKCRAEIGRLKTSSRAAEVSSQ